MTNRKLALGPLGDEVVNFAVVDGVAVAATSARCFARVEASPADLLTMIDGGLPVIFSRKAEASYLDLDVWDALCVVMLGVQLPAYEHTRRAARRLRDAVRECDGDPDRIDRFLGTNE